MIGILDYGAGNLASVERALAHLQVPCRRLERPEGFVGLTGLILPGVGAYGAAVAALRTRELWAPLREALDGGLPFLGICLGMQVLMEGSEETPGVRGLGVFPGICRRLGASRVPHRGWNRLLPSGPSPVADLLAVNPLVYFVHSYRTESLVRGAEAAHTRLEGELIPAIWCRGSVWGMQFHPEKSGPVGLGLLARWVETTRKQAGGAA